MCVSSLLRFGLALCMAAFFPVVARASEPVISTMRSVRAVTEARGFFLTPAPDLSGREIPGDESPVTAIEIIRPNNEAVTIGRLYTSCSCIQLESQQRTFQPYERAVLDLRNVAPTPQNGYMYALYVQITSPIRTTLRYDIFLQSSRFKPLPVPEPVPPAAVEPEPAVEPAGEPAAETEATTKDKPEPETAASEKPAAEVPAAEAVEKSEPAQPETKSEPASEAAASEKTAAEAMEKSEPAQPETKSEPAPETAASEKPAAEAMEKSEPAQPETKSEPAPAPTVPEQDAKLKAQKEEPAADSALEGK